MRGALAVRIRRYLADDSGNATMGFVLMLPMFMYLFMATFEVGLYMTRETLIERAVDLVAREVRLGHIATPSHDNLKALICDNATMVQDCTGTLKLSLERVSTDTWTMPTGGTTCVDRADEVQPVTAYDANPTQRRVLMIMRACVIADSLFPSASLASFLPLDGEGGYKIIATTAFLNEP